MRGYSLVRGFAFRGSTVNTEKSVWRVVVYEEPAQLGVIRTMKNLEKDRKVGFMQT